jgi:hypothetical protein
MDWKLLGITIDGSDAHVNVSESTCAKREFDSNITNERDWQPVKQCDQGIWTRFGIKIDWSDGAVNAHDSIRLNREGDSNEINENDWQCEKHVEPRTWTLPGINLIQVMKMLPIQFVLLGNLSQIKLIYSVKNSLIQGFQQCPESFWVKWWLRKSQWFNSYLSWSWFKPDW